MGKIQNLLLILVSLLVLELFSKSAVSLILGINDGNYAHYYQDDPQLNMLTWTENYTPHPYFGYESPQLVASEKLLSEVTNDDFVIGILGGSVAGGFGGYLLRNSSHFESLREVLPTLKDKNLRIVVLAGGGYKQPQQFFVATYFMDKLDLVINVDGFNDAQPSHLMPVYPLDFPDLSAQFSGRTSQVGLYTGIGRAARWIYKNINRAPLSWKVPGLSRSSLYFLNWYYLHDLLYRIVRLSESAYYTNEFGVHQSEALRKASSRELVQKRLEIWKKYTILEDDLIGKRSGKPVFFFVQPNQYLKNSKPFSEQEKRVAVDQSRIESHHELMTLLKAAAEDLRRSEVPIVDLTGIFAQTNETVYKDSCCHLNDLGNQILAEKIVATIKTFALLPRAGLPDANPSARASGREPSNATALVER